MFVMKRDKHPASLQLLWITTSTHTSTHPALHQQFFGSLENTGIVSRAFIILAPQGAI